MPKDAELEYRRPVLRFLISHPAKWQVHFTASIDASHSLSAGGRLCLQPTERFYLEKPDHSERFKHPEKGNC